MVRIDPLTRLPQQPVVIRENLRFPDGITVVPSSRFDVVFDALPDAPNFRKADCSGSG